MAHLFISELDVFTKKHPKTTSKPIQYGTAGFRTGAEDLDFVIFRMGLLAVLRSKVKQATIGMMITASHNPEPDNGVKLVDPRGEMLEQGWEQLATRLVNVSDGELAATLSSLVEEQNIDMTQPATVSVGRDTRPSSVALCRAALDGVSTLAGTNVDHGVVTTPMLHYYVACRNSGSAATAESYYSKLATSFNSFVSQIPPSGNYLPRVVFDGANGVGALAMEELKVQLGDSLCVDVFNSGDGKLNHQCGADHVKVEQSAPAGVPVEAGTRCVSVDGDADRIVYFYTDDEGLFHLLDGDRIATLVAGYLMELVTLSSLDLELGLVQTAYANGNSTRYITQSLKVPVTCVPTGVKHLHHRAEQFDIGVYFEANGHGTVVFSPTAKGSIVTAASNTGLSTEQRDAAVKLATLMSLINQTVGDALADLLLVEAVLRARGWGLADWEACYTDLPNRQLKVLVKDRRVIVTEDAERTCVAPEGLQIAIDTLVTIPSLGRAFVRPSGTEDLVRVYAEAETRVDADKLATQVAQAVHLMAGGVGISPL